MTRCQLLAGALGLASWRARAHLEDYADTSVRALRLTTKGTVKSANLRPVVAGAQRRPAVSELGVTDAVLATIWRFAPQGITHEVSPLAERYFTGSDIAFVDGDTRRILLYQAKVARLSGLALRLKSEVTVHQRTLLTSKRPLMIAGHNYSLTGRLAMYQTEYGANWYGTRRSFPAWRSVALAGLGGLPAADLVERGASQDYYALVMAGEDASPCGVMAGSLPLGSGALSSVDVRNSWPWEYDVYKWCTAQPSPLDDRRRNAESISPDVEAFEPIDDATSGWDTRDYGDLSEVVEELRRIIEPDGTRRLQVIAF